MPLSDRSVLWAASAFVWRLCLTDADSVPPQSTKRVRRVRYLRAFRRPKQLPDGNGRQSFCRIEDGMERPPASSASVLSRMKRQPRRDTHAELQVRRVLHARGVRFRVDVPLERHLRCRADIAWRGVRLAVFIDGCFWHGCPIHATRPKSNEQWWARKLDENVERDLRISSALRSCGWVVLRFWEHEDPETVAEVICVRLGELRNPTNISLEVD